MGAWGGGVASGHKTVNEGGEGLNAKATGCVASFPPLPRACAGEGWGGGLAANANQSKPPARCATLPLMPSSDCGPPCVAMESVGIFAASIRCRRTSWTSPVGSFGLPSRPMADNTLLPENTRGGSDFTQRVLVCDLTRRLPPRRSPTPARERERTPSPRAYAGVGWGEGAPRSMSATIRRAAATGSSARMIGRPTTR